MTLQSRIKHNLILFSEEKLNERRRLLLHVADDSHVQKTVINKSLMTEPVLHQVECKSNALDNLTFFLLLYFIIKSSTSN